MAPSSPCKSNGTVRAAAATLLDTASWYCAIAILALILLGFIRADGDQVVSKWGNNQLLLNDHRPCDEIYVVGEGETLHTISDKCGDPYIVERNPHIHDPDDVFPGLVVRIISPPSEPAAARKLLALR